MYTLYAADFASWRAQARILLSTNIVPFDVSWSQISEPGLFGDAPLPSARKDFQLTVPKAFMALAHVVSHHRDARKWELLYQLLFRLHHGEKHLLRIVSDPLIQALELMSKAVKRDAHKMKAFVRFRKMEDADGEEVFIAWHNPDHLVVPYTAPFFSRRFASMQWSILTPDASVHWDGEALHYSKGIPAEEAPPPDVLEDLWRDYYRAIFNPARIKIKTMKREMPTRHWKTLPETQIIHDMLLEAPARVAEMVKYTQAMADSAAPFLPDIPTFENLSAAAKGCEGCELYKPATQTVFGEGNLQAEIMLVGEQPGDREDMAGQPFIGPAGQLLDAALEQIGLRREELYITNAVKHFRFLYKDSFRQHRAPSRYHINACKPWLKAEMALVKPKLVVCLGNSAARAVIQPNFVMGDARGHFFEGEPTHMATFHPAAILRSSGAMQAEMQQQFMEDLSSAKRYVSSF